MFGKIGEAFISIFADASEFESGAEKHGQGIGSKMGGAISGALGKAMKVGAGLGVTAFGAVAAKGFQRLNALDQAKAKMRGLFDDATASAMGFTDQAALVDNVMGSALTSVKGTAFGLGDAAKAAANALNSGIEPGEQLDRTLKAIVGSAAASGTSMEDLSYIFNKAATTQRADNEILLMLAERGIPIYKQLAKDMGVSEDAVREMARTGKVSFDQLVDSAGEASKNVAAEMGTTLQGRLSNAWAAVGRIGANLFGGVFDSLGDGVGKATEWLSSLEPLALSVGEWLGSSVDSILPKAQALFDSIMTKGQALFDFFKTGDFTAAFREAFGVEEDSPLVTVLTTVRDIGSTVFTEITGGIRAFAEAWKAGDGDVTSSGLPGFLERVAGAARDLFDFFSSNVRPVFDQVAGVITDRILPTFDKFFQQLKADIVPILQQVGMFFQDKVVPAFKLVAGFIMDTLVPAFMGIWATIVENVLPIVSKVVEVFNQHIVPALASFGAVITDKVVPFLVRLAGVIVPVVKWIIELAANILGKVIPVILDFAGPVIGFLIKAAGALFGAIFSAFNGIFDVIGAVVSWLTGTAWPAIQTAWDAISSGAMWLWENAIKPAWEGIKSGISAVVDWLSNTAWPFVKGVFDKIGAAAEFLYVNFIRPHWILIKAGIEVVVNWLKGTAWPFIKDVFDKIGAGAKWLYENAIKPAWERIKKGIEVVVSWLKDTAWPFIKQVWDWIAAGAKWLWENGIKPAWDNVRGGIEVVVTWLRDTAWPIIQAAWDKISDGAKAMWEKWIKPAFDNFKDGIDRVVEGVTKAKDAIATVWGKITDAISGPLDKAKTFINDKFIRPLNKLFETLKMTLRIPEIGGTAAKDSGSLGKPAPGMASGGAVPGFSPHPRADNIPIWATAGEYVLPVNSTKRLMSQVGAQGMEMLRRGQIPGYALGGLIDAGKAGISWIKERGTDIIDLASKAWDVISDPAKALRDFASKALEGIGDSPIVQAMASGARQIIDTLVEKVKGFFAPEGGGGGGGGGGGNNMGWKAMEAWFESAFPGMKITSGFRPGAVSVTGIKSDHSVGRAIDMPASMAIFNKIDSTWKNIRQLLYSPAGPRQIRGGRRSDTIGSPLRAQHWDHVHWAMADGGWVSPFKPFVADRGAVLAPGLNLLDNRTGKPEPLARTDQPVRLDPRDIDLLAERIGRGVERGAFRGVAEIGRGL